eukprot:SAG31_NODE_2751_length_5144_cov_2.392666_7_plen_92_part_00
MIGRDRHFLVLSIVFSLHSVQQLLHLLWGQTIGMGKIYHETMPPGNEQDYKYAWSPEAVYPDGGQRGQGEVKPACADVLLAARSHDGAPSC